MVAEDPATVEVNSAEVFPTGTGAGGTITVPGFLPSIVVKKVAEMIGAAVSAANDSKVREASGPVPEIGCTETIANRTVPGLVVFATNIAPGANVPWVN